MMCVCRINNKYYITLYYITLFFHMWFSLMWKFYWAGPWAHEYIKLRTVSYVM